MGAATNIARVHYSRNIMIEYASYGRAWLGRYGTIPDSGGEVAAKRSTTTITIGSNKKKEEKSYYLLLTCQSSS